MGAHASGEAHLSGAGRQTIGAMALRLLALTLSFLEYWLLNYYAFPLFDTVFIWTRELSAAVGGLVLAALALVSFWKTNAASRTLFTVGTPLAMVGGMALVGVGVSHGAVIPVALGASLVTAGAGLANIYVGLGCTQVSLGRLGALVAGAYALSFMLRLPLETLPTGVALALFTAIPVVSVACVARPAGALFERSMPESPAQMSVTSPRSFLPFSHHVFVTLVLFRVVYGFTLVFGEVGRAPVTPAWACVPLGLAALAALAATRLDGAGIRSHLTADLLFKTSLLCTIAGFLVVFLAEDAGVAGGGQRAEVAQVLLSCGTGFFEIVLYYTLIALGTKNPAGALPALAWGNALASWGTILGATLGRAANTASPSELGTICAGAVLVLAAYAIFVLPHLSFSRTIAGVESVPVAPEPEASSEPTVDMRERCAELAREHGLTEREEEVLELLARGRNARFIQEALSISYSTTKTHVGRVYRKLGVHAHQELIDLVEGASG